jgi:hypothetical protein
MQTLEDIRTGKTPIRHYLSYLLIERESDKRLYRFNPLMGVVPEGYTHLEDSYDENGMLLPEFWALVRWTPEQDKPKETPNET